MLVYEETANDLHLELSRIERSRHFVYVRAIIAHCVRRSHEKFCAIKMRNAKLRNHLNRKPVITFHQAHVLNTVNHMHAP